MRLFLFSLVFSLCCALYGQESSKLQALSIPSELGEGADAVIREDRLTFTVEDPGRAETHRRQVVTLLKADERFQTFGVAYDETREKVRDFELTLYDALGRKVKSLKNRDIQDVSAVSEGSLYESRRVRMGEIQHHRYPYTVVWEYTLQSKGISGYPGWSIPFGTSVEEALFTVEIPADIRLRTRSSGLNIKPRIYHDDTKIGYQWKIEEIPAIPYEPMAPSNLLPEIRCSPSLFEIEGYRGDASSWEAFGAFIYRLNDEREGLSPAMAERVRETAASAGSEPRQKIAALYELMRGMTRYVSVQLGIGGWKAFDAPYVEENKFGDCKALTYFLQDMLTEAGIKSVPALIRPGREPYRLDPEFSHPYTFSHVILYVPEEDLWLECTSDLAPPGYLGRSNMDRDVLLLTENGGKLQRTPDSRPELHRREGLTRARLDAEGRVQVVHHSSHQGGSQEVLRYVNAYLTTEKREQWFTENHALAPFQLKKMEIQPENARPFCTLQFEADAPHLASLSGKRLFVPLDRFLEPLLELPRTEERVHPVMSHKTFSCSDTLLLEPPEGFRVESLPFETETFEGPYGQFHYSLSTTPQGEIQMLRRASLQPFELPAERYGEAVDFFADLRRVEKGKIVLVKE